MPPKRRKVPAALSPERELIAWHGVLDCGIDFFRELDEIGVSRDQNVQQERAEDVWRRLGFLYLTYFPQTRPDDEPPWAWREFGPPPGWEGPLLLVTGGERLDLARKLYAKCGMRLGCDRG